MSLLVALLVSALPLHPAGDVAAEASKGAALLRGCQAEVRLMQLGSLDEATAPDLINGAYCIGYLNGFTAGSGAEDAAGICTHDQPMAALVLAYVQYMERNPQLGEEDKRLGLRLALRDAFPCRPSR